MKIKLTSICLFTMQSRDQVDQQMSSLQVKIRKKFTPVWPARAVSFLRPLHHMHNA